MLTTAESKLKVCKGSPTFVFELHYLGWNISKYNEKRSEALQFFYHLQIILLCEHLIYQCLATWDEISKKKIYKIKY